jgi:hypothetical protein
MFLEVKRTAAALAGGPPAAGASVPRQPVSKARAIVQIVLTAVLVPVCLWALFGTTPYGDAARNTAAALLGSVVTYWLKD